MGLDCKSRPAARHEHPQGRSNGMEHPQGRSNGTARYIRWVGNGHQCSVNIRWVGIHEVYITTNPSGLTRSLSVTDYEIEYDN